MKREITTAITKPLNILPTIGSFIYNSAKMIAKRSVVVEIVCALLIILFIYTGINKLLDFNKFKYEMGRSPFIQNMSDYISILVPVGEILIALALIPRRIRGWALLASYSIMTLFTGYIWLMLNYAYDLPCSCGGVLSQMTWNDHLYFNIAYTVLAGSAFILHDPKKSKSI